MHGMALGPGSPSSRPERSGVEGPLFLPLAAIRGRKVSPLGTFRCSGRDDGISYAVAQEPNDEEGRDGG